MDGFPERSHKNVTMAGDFDSLCMIFLSFKKTCSRVANGVQCHPHIHFFPTARPIGIVAILKVMCIDSLVRFDYAFQNVNVSAITCHPYRPENRG